MQLFPSIHTISLWVNNLAVHPASSPCVLEKAIAMVTPALMVTLAMSNGAHPGQPSRSKNNNQTYWWRQHITSVSSEYWKARLAETGSGTKSGKERERGKRAPHVLSRARVDNARRQTGRLAERVGTHSSMMENKGFVCHRRDRINQNKQPRTD